MISARRSFVLGALTFPAFAASATGAKAAAPSLVGRLSDAVVKHAPGLDRLIASGTALEIIYEGTGFFEAPLWVPDADGGYLAFTDIAGNRIGRLNADGGATAIADPVFDGNDVSGLPIYKFKKRYLVMAGPNGMTMDGQGRFVYCGFAGSRQILRLEPDGTSTVLASHFDGKRLNTPNDLTYKSDGALYFTDTDMRFAASPATPTPVSGENRVPHAGVYRLANGQVELLSREIERPNGIAFSPDEMILYVNDTFRRMIWQFDVKPDGSLANLRPFFDMSTSQGNGPADGLKVDAEGNIFSTGPGGLWIFSRDGQHLGTVKTAEFLTNVAFGGRDGRTLFLSSPSYLYRLRTKTSAPKW